MTAAELEDVLLRAKFRRWLTVDEARQFVGNLRALADMAPDPPPSKTRRSADPDDEYLLALAGVAADVSALISGDHHLTDLSDADPPVMTPAAFLAALPSE